MLTLNKTGVYNITEQKSHVFLYNKDPNVILCYCFDTQLMFRSSLALSCPRVYVHFYAVPTPFRRMREGGGILVL